MSRRADLILEIHLRLHGISEKSRLRSIPQTNSGQELTSKVAEFGANVLQSHIAYSVA